MTVTTPIAGRGVEARGLAEAGGDINGVGDVGVEQRRVEPALPRAGGCPTMSPKCGTSAMLRGVVSLLRSSLARDLGRFSSPLPSPLPAMCAVFAAAAQRAPPATTTTLTRPPCSAPIPPSAPPTPLDGACVDRLRGHCRPPIRSAPIVALHRAEPFRPRSRHDAVRRNALGVAQRFLVTDLDGEPRTAGRTTDRLPGRFRP